MKQFSLEEFKKDPFKKVVTRDGRQVRIICVDYENDKPIIGLVKQKYEDIEIAYNFKKDGSFCDQEWKLDLFFASKKKEHFNPKTLQPFDKVLVRNSLENFWKCSYFSHIDNTAIYKYNCATMQHRLCIPYNDETKHLVGTNDEASEYYRYWDE